MKMASQKRRKIENGQLGQKNSFGSAQVLDEVQKSGLSEAAPLKCLYSNGAKELNLDLDAKYPHLTRAVLPIWKARTHALHANSTQFRKDVYLARNLMLLLHIWTSPELPKGWGTKAKSKAERSISIFRELESRSGSLSQTVDSFVGNFSAEHSNLFVISATMLKKYLDAFRTVLLAELALSKKWIVREAKVINSIREMVGVDAGKVIESARTNYLKGGSSQHFQMRNNADKWRDRVRVRNRRHVKKLENNVK